MTILEQVAGLTSYVTGMSVAVGLALGVVPLRVIVWAARKMLDAL